jgi:homoserine O-acetyltransferase
VRKVVVVIGASTGGAIALEWAFFGTDYVGSIVAIASASQAGGWFIGWNEAQRQSILLDRLYHDGRYLPERQPNMGLKAARMTAFLSHRHPTSSFFGDTRHKIAASNSDRVTIITKEPKERVFSKGNDHTSIQHRLGLEADDFVRRFDANCYLSLLNKIDTHCLRRERAKTMDDALGLIEQPVLVIGFTSDGLFPPSEQEELATRLPNGQLVMIDSDEGHEAFLDNTVTKEINTAIAEFMSQLSK